MSDNAIFIDLIHDIAKALNASVVPQESGPDLRVIELSGPDVAGLRIVARRGYNAERSRVRFSMSLMALKGDADFREMPAVHELETAAAISRGCAVIVRQLQSKIIAPAIPMRAEWLATCVKRTQEKAEHTASIARYRAAVPNARIEDNGEFYLSRADGGYIRGRINGDGGLSIERISSVPEFRAITMLAVIAA